MKIAKALKFKNRLAGEVSRLKHIVSTQNSRDASHEATYDVLSIVNDLIPKRVEELVLVKTAIACANAGMIWNSDVSMYKNTAYWAIFMMAELKGLVAIYRSMDTKNGSFQEYSCNGNVEPKPTVYVAAFNQLAVDALVAQTEKMIDELQDSLDTKNATLNVSALDNISL